MAWLQLAPGFEEGEPQSAQPYSEDGHISLKLEEFHLGGTPPASTEHGGNSEVEANAVVVHRIGASATLMEEPVDALVDNGVRTLTMQHTMVTYVFG